MKYKYKVGDIVWGNTEKPVFPGRKGKIIRRFKGKLINIYTIRCIGEDFELEESKLQKEEPE